MNETTHDVHKQPAATVACYGCGTKLDDRYGWRAITWIAVAGVDQPHCRHCTANHAAKQAFGGMYLSMASGPNRAARRTQAQAKPAPVVKPAKQRRAAKKVEAAKAGKVAA